MALGRPLWDTHDTTDYSRAFRTVRVVAELRNRHYEIPIEADVVRTLEARARKAGVTLGQLASDLLRRQLSTSE
jgi:predicted phosphatase